MPVRSLFLCVWVWWLQLTALQSGRLLLLGALQYSEPPATESVWINFLCVLSNALAIDILLKLSVMCSEFLCSLFMERRLGKRKSRRHGEDSSSTKAEGWNSFWGSSQPEQHRVSCLFIGRQGASFISHWLKASFQVLQENKGVVWLTWSWRVTKRALYKGLFTPIHTPPIRVFAALHFTFLYPSLNDLCISSAESHDTNSHLSANRKQLLPVCSVLTVSSEKLNTQPWYSPWCPNTDTL